MTTPTQKESCTLANKCGLPVRAWTEEIHALVTAAYERGAKEALAQAATIIRADKWPWAIADYQQQYNAGIEELAKRVEQIGEQDAL